MSSAPTIMISSTFYDLRQIRADLARFITDDLGYIPLLSELPSFPVDPDLDTIENCRVRVEKNANILVLVIGGRYGSIDNRTDKSITNLEFLTARRKGIPIYAFVEKGILAVLPVWKNNPAADFSGEQSGGDRSCNHTLSARLDRLLYMTSALERTSSKS